jgi:hypothetical protein
MAIEVGHQFKSVRSVGPTWVVQRIIDGPVPHAILTQTGDASSIRTLSLSALEDTHMFERTGETTPLAMPVAKKGTVRGFMRIAKKAA